MIGSTFLYKLLGVSSFIGLAITCLFLPVNHYASSVVVAAQDNLMKARDERVALTNEVELTSFTSNAADNQFCSGIGGY